LGIRKIGRDGRDVEELRESGPGVEPLGALKAVAGNGREDRAPERAERVTALDDPIAMMCAMMPCEKLHSWKACDDLARMLYTATTAFPSDARYGLTSQLRRAAGYSAATIGEGSALRGPRQLCRHLNIALGSLAEVAYLLRLARDLGYLGTEHYAGLSAQRARAGLLTWKLYRSLSRDGSPWPVAELEALLEPRR
jgi:four helix bundle protein